MTEAGEEEDLEWMACRDKVRLEEFNGSCFIDYIILPNVACDTCALFYLGELASLESMI